MRRITNITSKPKQKFSIISDEGKQITISLVFLPTQENWFISVECGDFKMYNYRVDVSPNVLDKFHNIIDFGLCIDSEDGFAPFRQTDFQDGKAMLFLLNKDDVNFMTGFLNGKTQ